MKAFIDLIIAETTATIEGLMGKTPNVTHTSDSDVSLENLPASYAISYITVSGDGNGELGMIVPVEMATALADMMLGGDGEAKNEMSDDDLDAIKEISSNIFGAISTSLNAQKELPKLNFNCTNIEFITQDIELSRFNKAYVFNFLLEPIQSSFIVLANADFANLFETNTRQSAQDTNTESTSAQTNHILSPTEFKNINMIAMDIGSVIELNQLANDPLEILVDDKVIAKGEVVIVDGNFGIQITDIGTKRDRLEQLRG